MGDGGNDKLGWRGDYNSFAAEDATVEMATHSLRVFNMLLADTHVEGVKTDVLSVPTRSI